MPTPSLSYLIKGKVKLSGTELVVEGATVKVTDSTLDESTSVTTNAQGEYIANLSGLDGTWSQGDSLSIKASIGNRSKTETGTVSGGGMTVNFTLGITTYPSYNICTEESISFVAKDIMDVDKTFTWGTSGNSNNRITKEVNEYGSFTLTKYFKYNSARRVINENWVVE